MHAKRWDDQPDEVLVGERVAEFYVRGKRGSAFEIRKASDQLWYLSVGNLFGSQTLRCTSPEAVIRALAYAVRAIDRETTTAPPPEGATLIAG